MHQIFSGFATTTWTSVPEQLMTYFAVSFIYLLKNDTYEDIYTRINHFINGMLCSVFSILYN